MVPLWEHRRGYKELWRRIAGGDSQLVQVYRTAGLYVELVRRGLGEGAKAHQIAVDEVIDIPVGNGDPHGHPLVPITVVGEIREVSLCSDR